ncbi:MAG: T9SS type A sorting domain-containing protein [Cyclobacteriaceae bacterium]|jgi:hypothetical protein|nr:T9SS type A sorting domain-containing protein [Cyclobacteriaceae bacterium]
MRITLLLFLVLNFAKFAQAQPFPPPSVIDMYPLLVDVGGAVTLTGTNFNSVAQVYLGVPEQGIFPGYGIILSKTNTEIKFIPVGNTLVGSVTVVLSWYYDAGANYQGDDNYGLYNSPINLTILPLNEARFPVTETVSERKPVGLSTQAKFGSTVEISGDGNVAAITASGENKVRIYTKTNGSWIEVQTIHNSASGFGASLSLSYDGSLLLIGAPLDNSNTGSIFIYKKETSTWNLLGNKRTIVNNQKSLEGGLGYSMSITADGSIIATGCPNFNFGRGVTIVFRKNSFGEYIQDSPISISNNTYNNGNSLINQGYSVKLSADGSKLLVGTLKDRTLRHGSVYEIGSVTVFTNSGSWFESQKIIPPQNLIDSSVPSSLFGTSIAISGNGKLIGIISGNGKRLHIYENTASQYSLTNTFDAPISSTNGFGLNGALAMSLDGRSIFVGDLYRSSWFGSSPGNSGNIKTYYRLNGLWQRGQDITPTSNYDEDEVGRNIAVSANGRTLLFGGWGHNTVPADASFEEINWNNNEGAFWVFEAESPNPQPTISEVSISNVTNTDLQMTFGPNKPGIGRLVVAKTGTSPSFVPVNGTVYTKNQNLPSDEKVLHIGTMLQTGIFGLTPATTYHFKVYEYVIENGVYKYGTTPTLVSATTLSEGLSFVTTPADNAINQQATISFRVKTQTNVTSYKIELSKEQDFSTLFKSATGGMPLPITGLEYNTTYFTRVKPNIQGVENFGKVTRFTTAPAEFFTHMVSPAHLAANVNPLTVSIRSNSIVGANSYTVQISSQASFTGDVQEKISTTSTVAFTGLAYNTNYFVRIKTNVSPNWGTVKSFTTGNPEQFAFVKSPANAIANVNVNLNIGLNAVLNASLYTLELSTSQDFAQNVQTYTSDKTTIPITGLSFSTTYYSRVKTNLSDTWGQIRSFTTGSLISLSYLLSPVKPNQSVLPTLVTNNVGASQYTFQLSTQNNFSSQVQTFNSDKPSFKLIQPIAYNTTYFVRISNNLLPGWGEVKSFSTGTPDFFSYVSSPKHLAINVNYVTNITSNVVQGASTYTIEVATDQDFTQNVQTKSGANVQPFTLMQNMQYFSRVRTNLSPIWGAIKSFTTGNAVSLCYITSPKANAVGVSLKPRVSVNAPGDATQVRVQLSSDGNFISNVLELTTTLRYVTFNNLQNNTVYYARVSTNLVPNVWGTVSSFTTLAETGAREKQETVYVEEFEKQAENIWQIYPNPFENCVQIKQKDSAVFFRAKLINMLGQLLEERESINGEVTLGCSVFNGNYLIEIVTDKNEKIIKRVVKK